MRASFATTPELRQALDQVREWICARFLLSADALILVVESASRLPGFPPRETVIWFWGEGGTTHHFKIFKPAQDVAEDDLPPSWMKNALVVPDGYVCSCC